jgi:hypothetical protein
VKSLEIARKYYLARGHVRFWQSCRQIAAELSPSPLQRRQWLG